MNCFGLINLALATFEYEGSEETFEPEERGDENVEAFVWAREFLPAIKPKGVQALFRRSPFARRLQRDKSKLEEAKPAYASTTSRKWH